MNLVESWRCAQEPLLREPIIILRTTDGRELEFMLPPSAAAQLGAALIKEGRLTASVRLVH